MPTADVDVNLHVHGVRATVKNNLTIKFSQTFFRSRLKISPMWSYACFVVARFGCRMAADSRGVARLPGSDVVLHGGLDLHTVIVDGGGNIANALSLHVRAVRKEIPMLHERIVLGCPLADIFPVTNIFNRQYTCTA